MMFSSPPLHTAIVVAPLCAVAGALAWAAVSDLRRYIIPNLVSVVVALAYCVRASALPGREIFGDVAVALVAMVIGGMLFAWAKMGGGDVKLFASLSLWAGAALISPFALVVSCAAFVLALLMLSPLGAIMPAASPSATALTGSDRGRRRPMPFGVAIVAGGFYLMARRLADGH